MNCHQKSTDRVRAPAAQVREHREAGAVSDVSEAHGRSAARWEAPAALEEMVLAHAHARGGKRAKWTGPLSRPIGRA